MIDLIFYWTGAVICTIGAVAGAVFVAALLVDYIWRKVWDFNAFRRVIEEANKQGVKLTK